MQMPPWTAWAWLCCLWMIPPLMAHAVAWNASRPGPWLTRPQVYAGLRQTSTASTGSAPGFVHWGALWFPLADYQGWQGLGFLS